MRLSDFLFALFIFGTLFVGLQVLDSIPSQTEIYTIISK